MSKHYDINELPEDKFTITLKIIDQYQSKYPGLRAKIKWATYRHGYFCGGSHKNFNITTCKGKCLFCQKPEDIH